MKSKRSARKTRREKKKIKKKTIVLFSSLVIIIASFFYIMNHDYFAIETIRIEGQKTLIESDIRNVIKDYLGGKKIGLIRNDNILLLPIATIERTLKESFPKIADLSVEIENGDELVVLIGERSAHSLWCIDREYESVFDQECYFADQDGKLYARAPYFSGNIYLKVFIQPLLDEKYIGTNINSILDSEMFFDFINDLELDYSLRIKQIFFDEFDDARIQLARIGNIIYDEQEVHILYSKLDEYEIILRNIGITLNFDEFKKEFNNRPQSLESIDVRFDGRIFYTFTSIDSESE